MVDWRSSNDCPWVDNDGRSFPLYESHVLSMRFPRWTNLVSVTPRYPEGGCELCHRTAGTRCYHNRLKWPCYQKQRANVLWPIVADRYKQVDRIPCTWCGDSTDPMPSSCHTCGTFLGPPSSMCALCRATIKSCRLCIASAIIAPDHRNLAMRIFGHLPEPGRPMLKRLTGDALETCVSCKKRKLCERCPACRLVWTCDASGCQAMHHPMCPLLRDGAIVTSIYVWQVEYVRGLRSVAYSCGPDYVERYNMLLGGLNID